MNIRAYLTRPTPIWFSLVRLCVLCGMLLFIGWSPEWKEAISELGKAATVMAKEVVRNAESQAGQEAGSAVGAAVSNKKSGVN